jgi:hypothetical protein
MKTRLLLVSVIVAGLFLVGARVTGTSVGVARAQVGPGVAFSPAGGAADAQRVVEFANFGSDETIVLRFTDANGVTAAVGNLDAFYAVTQDDGSGTFGFVPSQWLTPLSRGMWTVQVTGASSGLVATTSFTIE